MMDRESRERTIPTLVTLLVAAFLMMTFDVRATGGSTAGGVRSGALRVLAPLQNVAAFVIDPIADLGDTLAGLATLRAENGALRTEVAKLQADLAGYQDLRARLRVLEQVNDLEILDPDIPQISANVIGRPDPFGASFIIDQGTDDGISVGHPVVDPYGYVVGKVVEVSPGFATVIPITQDREAVTVLVDGQVGSLSSLLGSDLLRLEVFDAVDALRAGDLVVTSAVSVTYPQGLPVGEVVEDVALDGTALSASVRPFADPDTLRIVVVITWPPEPSSTQTTATTALSTTSTSNGGTTTTGGG
jgi:rod shape-determining protein MreC